MKTKVYCIINNKHYCLEFPEFIPNRGANKYYDFLPSNFWEYLVNNKIKLHNNNGPVIRYFNGLNVYKNEMCEIINLSQMENLVYKNIKYRPTEKFYYWVEQTNHKVCLICEDFCKQECFI